MNLRVFYLTRRGLSDGYSPHPDNQRPWAGYSPTSRNHPKPTVLYVPQYVANFVSKKSCSI